MRSFRKILVSLLILVLFTLGVNKGAHYLYQSVIEDSMVLVSKELDELDGTLDTLLLGTSLMDRGLDPHVIDRELGASSFNLGASVQPPSGSYYVLKDQLKRNPVKRVFMGITVSSLTAETDATNSYAKRRTFEELFNPFVKAQYFFDILEPKEYERFLFYPAWIYNVLDFETIKTNVEYRRSEDFKNGVSHKDAQYIYYGRGLESTENVYVPSDNYKTDEKIFWSRDKVAEVNVKYLTKMADYCRENGIELNLLVFPHTRQAAETQGDLADMDAYLEEFCEEKGVRLFDYNYTAREDIYDILTDDCFDDSKHLNRKGAEKMAELLCEDYKKS